MQHESTPLRQKRDNNTTPCSTAIGRRQGRRRISVRTPLQEDDYVRKVTNSSVSNPIERLPGRKTTPKFESPCEENHRWKNSSSRSQEQESPQDIFLDTKRASDHQPQNSAVQFHNAVKRLAVRSLSTDGDHAAASPTRKIYIVDNQTQVSAEPCNFSRRFHTRLNATNANKALALQECDITSVKRQVHSLAAYGDNVKTPVRSERYGGPVTPGSLHHNRRSVHNSPERTIRKNRNFSRPVQPLHCETSKQPFRTATEFPSKKHDIEIKPCDSTHSNAEHQQTSAVKNELTPNIGHGELSGKHAITTSGAGENLEPKNTRSTNPTKHPAIAGPSTYVRKKDLGDNRRQLKHWQIWVQRLIITLIIIGVNIGLGLAYFRSFKHPYLLGILVFMKSKDILSTIADLLGILHYHLHRLIWPPREPDSRWILSLVCAYAETEEQIMKTITSLCMNITTPHKQVICIILDGKPRDIVSRMDTVRVEFKRPYVTWRGVQGNLHIYAGTIQKLPVVLIHKAQNAGKKDSLVLGHDLFNYPRKDMPHSTKVLREEIWQLTMPHLVPKKHLTAFDFVFCTDADSTIHKTCLQKLANALCQTTGAIAGCGVLFAEFGHGWTEFAPWHLFQQFQYTFGQYVRRQAESTFGRVTCLPGCVTMIVVRSEVGDALSEYAKPVTGYNLLRHQVQYLGTDRRLTWCILSQNKHLRTIFVPEAVSETVTPSSLSHYLSQRRRWASNAYFNDFFYLFGAQQRLTTRLFAAVDILRLTLVFYRVFNTAYFIHGLATNFYIIKIIPTLIVTKTPATWYLLLVLIKEPMLRRRLHKILLGMLINQVISPILSVIVFLNVLLHVGSQAWGTTGASTQGNPMASLHHNVEPSKTWTPGRLAQSVREAIQGLTPARSRRDRRKSSRSPDALTTIPSKPKKSDASTVSSHDSTKSTTGKVESRARSASFMTTTCLDRDRTKSKASDPQQTPVRQSFRNENPTTSAYKGNPHQGDDPNTMQQQTPTRNTRRIFGT